jgi:hypothetical protein
MFLENGKKNVKIYKNSSQRQMPGLKVVLKMNERSETKSENLNMNPDR